MTIPANSHKPTPNVLARILLAAFTLLGLCLGALAMYAAWQHNPQGEFHDGTGVHWLYWFGIGFSWFVAVAGIPWLIAAAVIIGSKLRRP